jgi:ABC-2 type transport system permease protein
VAQWNPFYWVTNGMRALYAGRSGAASVWESLVIVAVLAMLAMIWSVRMFARTVTAAVVRDHGVVGAGQVDVTA